MKLIPITGGIVLSKNTRKFRVGVHYGTERLIKMKKFACKWGLGGGFGGIEFDDPTIEEFESKDDADTYVYEQACQEYEDYVGMYGLRDIDEIMEEDGVDREEAEQIYNDERESWIEYEAMEVK